ncbi:lipase/esterase, putative [Talaromyces stipitatus ATCC 10500]|uniref:Lipase/esterase, putative n=1 Tax=Talaromyces stipitatus (strain ATCC 10500 / CBS 375.48 / QM 6759 / NRRL 1006) TaxID=441959 RepID=B8LZ04_TALSN|nr:lipase/esterase, putative [Talaromyces stipitatus ATCC 10500]EED23512.1 lipase/esterase, putative [Talaromyces stipitatus ATCC 10500]
MKPLHAEWSSFITQHPKIRHDDHQRNRDFYDSPAGHKFVTEVLTIDTTIPASDDHNIPIRIYTAKRSELSHGVVIFFHSGGFTSGSLETEDVSCRYMALSGPLTVLSVEYRLSPAYTFPVPVNDGWDAFRYIVTNLSSLVANLAPGMVNMVVSGTSSGGQLAAIVSQRAQTWMKGNISCAKITMSGVLLRAPVTVNGTDSHFIPPRLRDIHKSWCAELETTLLKRHEMEENHDALGVPLNERNSPEAYPLWGQFHGLPKVYIQICDVDILRDDAVCYAQSLRDAGVEVQESLYLDLPHIFWIYAHHLDVSKKAQEDCVQGLNWLLASTG